jgi:signal transduction histidine kinase
MAARQREVSDELETYSALVVNRERARIARDLHDIVAHCIAVMVIQAGAGRLTSTASRDQATAAFIQIREAGSEALAEMQKLVDMLGPAEAGANGKARLDDLMHQVQAAGLSVDVIGADSDVDETAFRIVQEGLTNVLKHAPGAPVTVSFRQLETEVVIEITNARMSPGHPRIGFKTSRRGLSGIRERVEARGGEVHAGALPDGGWQLRVRLPRQCARDDAGLAPGINLPLQSPARY